MEATTRRLRRDKRAVSTVIVVMLSLVLVTIIVGNIVLWSYQMNQIDLERMQEKVQLINVTRMIRSPWFTAQTEYRTNAGSRLSGSFTDTQIEGGSYETFQEEKAQAFNPLGYVLGGSTRYASGSVADLSSDDGSYMSFRGYPNYETGYQESLGISVATSTTYQDKIVLSFTPQVTADFFIIATAEVQGTSTDYQAWAQLAVNSSTFQELRYRVKDATDWYPFCALKRIAMNENTNYVISLQYCTNNAGATASIRNARLLVMSLKAEYAESEALSSTSSSSWQDKVTLAFAPATGGDYLILATVNYQGSQTNRDTNIRLVQDCTTVHAEMVGRPGTGTTANYYTFGAFRRISLDASAHNFTLQYCASGVPAVAGVNYAHILAIRLDQFGSSSYSESEGESIPAAANTWYDKVTNSYTADAASYLTIGSAAYRSGSTSYSVSLDFQMESASRQTALVEHRDGTIYESAFFMTQQALSGGSVTDKIRWMGESTNARIKNARLVSCKLPTQTQMAEAEFTGTSEAQNWTQLEWTVDSSFTTTGVATTFQLYDYDVGQYPTSGDGYMTDTIGLTDVTANQTITSTPTRFRDASGNWKTRIRGVKATVTQFELKVDWIEFKATSSDVYRLSLANGFQIDLSVYPLRHVQGLELLIRYNVSEDSEKWFMRMYNRSASSFSDAGFNATIGHQPTLGVWNEYAISIVDDWLDYVDINGSMIIELSDEGLAANQTVADIDFIGARAIVDGSRFELRNSSPFTTHIVAVWIVNSALHQRYSANLFINSGEETTYVRADVKLPESGFITKMVTEKGNISIFP